MARNDPNQIFENLPKKDFLSCQEVAKYLDVSESLVRRARARDDIPAVKIGGRVMFSTVRLKEWLLKRGA